MKAKDFGVDDGAIHVEEYETHIEVRPLRNLGPHEVAKINAVVNRHGGKTGDLNEFGVCFTIPLEDHSEKVEERWIEISKLVPPPFLVRGVKEEAVQVILESIKKTGRILHALVVRPSPTNEGVFEWVLGTQRLEAARRLGWKRVRCDIYRGLSDQDCIEWQFVENDARNDLTDYDRGRAMVELQQRFPKMYPDLKDSESRFGYDKGQISRYISHYWLIERVKPSLEPSQVERVKRMPEGVTRVIRSAPAASQAEIVVKAAMSGANSREVEGMVAAVTPSRDSQPTALQKELNRARRLDDAEASRKEALKRKLQRTYSEEMANDIMTWCEKRDVPEEIMVEMFAVIMNSAWPKMKELGLMDEFLEEALAEVKEKAPA